MGYQMRCFTLKMCPDIPLNVPYPLSLSVPDQSGRGEILMKFLRHEREARVIWPLGEHFQPSFQQCYSLS